MTTTEYSKADDLARATHSSPHELLQVRWAWADKFEVMSIGETKTLIDGLGEKQTITRTEDGWTLTR